jgi:hypothetical protein
MDRRKVAQIGAILLAVGLTGLGVSLLLAHYFSALAFQFLVLLSPTGLVGTVGILLLFYAWAMPAERTCPACRAVNPKSSRFCGRCGRSLGLS